MTFARGERERLAGLLEAAGPDAGTLCAGWTTRDMAAHLVLRERRMDAAAGIQVKALAGWTQRVQDGYAARPYEELVRTFRSGPPTVSLFALPGADEAANLIEYFVHAEDVRRAGDDPSPAEPDPRLADALWKRLPMVVRFGAGAKPPVRLTLARPDGRTATVGPKDGPTVTVTGEPGELVLFAYGRGARAAVVADGAPEAVAALARVLPLP
ncbi:TIGR03085 family metal-binding protein [Kitasatospora sp. NPDC048365]